MRGRRESDGGDVAPRRGSRDPALGVEPPLEEVFSQIIFREGLHVIAYPAMLDVPNELVAFLADLLAAERVARGTRTDTRALSCTDQACSRWCGSERAVTYR